MNRFFSNTYLGVLVIVRLLLFALPFQRAIDEERGKFRSIDNTVLLSPQTLKIMSLGFDEIVSDIYWIRALQYFGNPDVPKSEKDPELTYKYFDLITELDPKFVNAYRFGGTFLATPYPHGLNDFKKGSLLFDKGRQNNPDNYRLPLEQGFLYYFYSDDKQKASDLFKEASEKDDVPGRRKESFKGMSAVTLEKSGNRELARKIWMDIYENSQYEGRRNFALLNLKELNTKDLEEKLTGYANEYEQIYGNFPEKVGDLLILKEVKKIPKDHEGLDFFIDQNSKTVKSTALNKHLVSAN